MKIYKSPPVSGIRRISNTLDSSLLSKENVNVQDESLKNENKIINQSNRHKNIDNNIIEDHNNDHHALISSEEFIEKRHSEIKSSNENDQLSIQIEKLKHENGYLQQALNSLQAKEQEDLCLEREQAKREGFEAGEKAVREEFNKSIERLESIAAELSRKVDAITLNTNPIVAEAVFTALCRILGENYTGNVLIEKIIDTVLKEVRENINIRVLVSDADYKLINMQTSKQLAFNVAKIKLIADPKITTGGCIVESDNGVWDARMETQLQKFKSSLIEASRSSEK